MEEIEIVRETEMVREREKVIFEGRWRYRDKESQFELRNFISDLVNWSTDR